MASTYYEYVLASRTRPLVSQAIQPPRAKPAAAPSKGAPSEQMRSGAAGGNQAPPEWAIEQERLRDNDLICTDDHPGWGTQGPGSFDGLKLVGGVDISFIPAAELAGASIEKPEVLLLLAAMSEFVAVPAGNFRADHPQLAIPGSDTHSHTDFRVGRGVHRGLPRVP